MASTAREFLFTTWEGGGNLPPVLTLVRRLRARGHRVRLLGDACTGAAATTAGAEFLSWQRAPSRPDTSPASDLMRDWEAADPAEVLRRIVHTLMCGPALAHAQDVGAELERGPADLIVTSEMLLGPMLAGESRAVPVVALASNIPIIPLPGVPPFGPGFAPARDAAERELHANVAAELERLLDEGLPPLNAARRALSLQPLSSVIEQYDRLERFLAATARAFDFPATQLPAKLRYVGPLLDEPAWVDGTEAPPPREQRRPRVVVAFSTTFQDQLDVLRRVVEALGALPVDAVVTTGPVIRPEDLRAPPNVLVVARASHDRLMHGAAAVVTHAGHGTVMRALRAGAPLLCLPMGRDQNDNAVRVTERGAGLRLPPSASTAQIGEALGRLLAEPAFRAAAARLGQAVAREIAPERVVDELEQLVAGRANGEPGAAAA